MALICFMDTRCCVGTNVDCIWRCYPHKNTKYRYLQKYMDLYIVFLERCLLAMMRKMLYNRCWASGQKEQHHGWNPQCCRVRIHGNSDRSLNHYVLFTHSDCTMEFFWISRKNCTVCAAPVPDDCLHSSSRNDRAAQMCEETRGGIL